MNVAGEFLWLLHTLMKITWDEVVSPFLLPKRSKQKSKAKRIPSRAVPKRRDNPFKAQYRRYPNERSDEWARKAAAENVARKSEARAALCATLRGLGIPFKIEERLNVYGHIYFADVWCHQHRIWFECDGAGHHNQKAYDRGRDEDIAAVTGFRVCRRWNSWYLKPGLSQRILIELGKR